MDIRNRLLLVFMALSLMFVYDFFANGRTVIDAFAQGFVRTSPARTEGWGISEGAPFLRKEGSQTHGAENLSSLVVKGTGDFEVIPSDSGMVALTYDIRTYGVSSMHVREYHEQVDVTSMRRGEHLEISLQTPERVAVVDGARVRYQLQVPDDLAIHLESEFGDINLHGVVAELSAKVRQGSVRVGKHRGAVTLEVSRGDIWLTEIEGDVTVEHERGRVEAVGIDGTFEFDGSRSTLTLDRAAEDVKTRIDRGAAAFFSSEGPLHVDAEMARVRVIRSQGDVEIQGRLSPVEVEGSNGGIDVTSDRANVLLRLSDSVAWDFDLDVRNGAVNTGMPLSADSSDGERPNESASTPSGRLPVTVQVSGGDIKVEPL